MALVVKGSGDQKMSRSEVVRHVARRAELRSIAGRQLLPADGARSGRRDEQGAILVLALIYIFAVGLIVAALATWASNDLKNTAKFTSARATSYSATAAMNVAIQSMRYHSQLSGNVTQNVATPLSYCWTPVGNPQVSQLTTNGVTVAVWCSTVENLASAATRVVTFSACQSTLNASSSAGAISSAASACAASPLLQAVVTFDDYPPGGSAPLTTQCTTWCGEGSTIDTWIWATSAT